MVLKTCFPLRVRPCFPSCLSTCKGIPCGFAPPGKPRGFAFVGFTCRADAEKAISLVNGQVRLFGCLL